MDTTLSEIYNILGEWRSTAPTLTGAVSNLVDAERQRNDRIHNLENALKVTLAYYRYQTERLTDDRSMPIIMAEAVLNKNGEYTDDTVELYLRQYRRNSELREVLECYADPAMWTSDVTIYYDNADGSEGEFTTDLGIRTVWNGDGEGFESAQEVVGAP